MPPAFLLTVLKILLLLLLYFFVWRAVRAVTVDLYGGGRERRARAPEQRQRAPRRQRRGAPSKVVVLDERGGRVSTHRLSGTLQIGRAPSADIRPDDTYVSQLHAKISNRNGSWIVEDLGSTNGTYLNQQKVTVPVQISPGDRIRVGKTYLEVRR
ncbi:MAG TPA: FHA domain-containing protein [Actinomycetota bacterium]|nr:FHA domain-containing protein [Actinomycetota bacterium]